MPISFTNPSVLWLLLPLLGLLSLPSIERAGRASATAARGGLQTLRRAATTRHWLGTALRGLIGLGLILALSGARWVQSVADLTTVFVLDLSDSVPAEEQERAETFIRQAVAAMPDGDRAAIVAFGEEALVERLASEARDLPAVASVPGASRTHISAAIRLALALFSEDSQKRLVLLSDGIENVGDALAQTELAAARGVEIAVVPLLAPPTEQEAYVSELQVPSAVRKGQSFVATAIIESTLAQEATLRVLGDGQLLSSQQVTLEPGSNRVQVTLTAEDTGFRRYEAVLAPALDTLPQNNLASGFTVVYGPPRVLIAAAAPEESDALQRALESTGVEVTQVNPGNLPTDLAALSSYDAVVLVNVPADALPDGAMEVLPVAVRELGRGLVMIGGETGYGAGSYLRTPIEKALPVDMDVRSRTREPNLALVLAIDKSGSMGRCHCNDSSLLPGQYERVESGLSKVDIAKDAVLMATAALGPLDYLGVVVFDDNAAWAVDLQQLPEVGVIQEAIGGLQAEGQTNIFASLAEAEQALVETSARFKHIILMTDGWSRSGDYEEFTARLAEEGITLSVVAAGLGSAEYLEGLALAGGGKYYPVPTIHEMPEIFLKETIRATGSYIIEEAFYPIQSGSTPILNGIDPMVLPALLGYNGTTPKATAQVVLVSPRGDPILAQWQYGLGRSVAWTSDMKGQWATDWLAWNRYNSFAAQLVAWTLPEPADENLQVATRLDGTDVHLQVAATDDAGQPRDLLQTEVTLVGPDLSSRSVALDQTAAGRYEGQASVSDPGTYLVQVVQRDEEGQPVAQRTTGLVVPYSPEYKRSGDGGALLRNLAQATGGTVLATPEETWAPTSAPAVRARPLWPMLMLLAALLFPIDVGVRRLRLAADDWQRLLAWVRERLHRPARTVSTARQPLLGELFEARERARRRGARETTEIQLPSEESVHQMPVSASEPRRAERPLTSAAQPDQTGERPGRAGSDSEEDTLARLHQARQRAQRRR